ncbi:PilN domain-containing protein [Desulfitibacter alkalitolerans]|uniref:PilN domain-containing protein n=1 Tax=Desulfitibacter alkalitolerans TaxID=264641 RepID=UPI00047F2CDC|nr:PilN domain-containing protein [Desulfitibacter alkalitolerans]
MAEINLLPKEKRPRKSLMLNKKLLLVMICSVFFLSYLLTLNLQLNSHLKTAEELRIEIDNYHSLIEDIEEIKAYGDLLEKQIQIYSELLEGSSSWGEKLEEINKMVPENSFITALHMEDNKFLMIKGYALTLGDIAAFINCLNDRQYYTSVRLHNAIEETRGDITLLKYEIVCGI